MASGRSLIIGISLALGACKAQPSETDDAGGASVTAREPAVETAAPILPADAAVAIPLDAAVVGPRRYQEEPYDLLEGTAADKASVKDVVGYYRITYLTENKRSCATEGASLLDSHNEPEFVVRYREARLAFPILDVVRHHALVRALDAHLQTFTGNFGPFGVC